MAAVTKRAINGEFARLRSKDFHDLANHDWTMRARGRFAAGDHLGDVAGITLRCVLFVLFRKVSGILPSVSRPPLGFFRTHSRTKPVLLWKVRYEVLRRDSYGRRWLLKNCHIASVVSISFL